MKYNNSHLDVVLQVFKGSEIFKNIKGISFETNLIDIISEKYIGELKKLMPDGFTLEQLRSIRAQITKNVDEANARLEKTSDVNKTSTHELFFSATYPLGVSLIQLYILNITINLLENNLYIPEENELIEVTQDDLLNSPQLKLVLNPELSLEQILEHYKIHKDTSDLYLAKTYPGVSELKDKIINYLTYQREGIITTFIFNGDQNAHMNYFFGTGIVLLAGVGYFDITVFKKVK